MEFENKKELCDALNKVVLITKLTVKELIGEATSLDEATKNLNSKIDILMKQSTNLVIVKELRKVQYNCGTGKRLNTDYDTEFERLMGWIAKDYGEQPSFIKKKTNERNLVLNLGSMDIHCVIKGNSDYKVFKHELEQRVGRVFC